MKLTFVPGSLTLLYAAAVIAAPIAFADALSDCDQQRDADLAIAGCTQLITTLAATADERAHAHANRGNAYGGKAQYEHAMRDLDRAIELNPHDAVAYATRGRVCLATGKHDDAIRDMDKAIEIDPRVPAVYISRGMAFAAKGMPDRAIQDYDKAIELYPNDAFYAGLAFEKKMKLLNQDLDKAIQLNPRDPLAWRHRGAKYHYGAGQPGRALRDLNKAIELNPRGVWSFTYRGDVYSLMNQYDAAIQDYSKAIELDPEGHVAYQRRAWVHFKAGTAGKGLPDAERSLQLKPKQAEALNVRGHILEALERREEAIADFRRALASDPGLKASAEGLRRLGAAP